MSEVTRGYRSCKINFWFRLNKKTGADQGNNIFLFSQISIFLMESGINC